MLWKVVLLDPLGPYPLANNLSELSVLRGRELLVGASTDRSDFYHQIMITDARSLTNCVGPPLPLGCLSGTQAHARLIASQRLQKARPREVTGDRLGLPFQGQALPLRPCVWILRILVSGGSGRSCDPSTYKPPKGSQPPRPCCASASKDPFVGVWPLGRPHNRRLFLGVQGATPDLPFDLGPCCGPFHPCCSQSKGRVRKFRNQGERPQRHPDGFCLVSAPVEKRLSLAYVSLQAAQLPAITPEFSSALAGCWVSALLCRRCLMSCLDSFFRLGNRHDNDSPANEAVPLPRKAAGELALLAALSPVMCSDVSSPFDSKVYCSDASSVKGAFCSAEVGSEISSALWRSADKKGFYSRLVDQGPPGVGLETSALEEPPCPFEAKPTAERPLAMFYDHLEICGGSGPISSALADLGFRPGPVIDLSVSPIFDFSQTRVVEWVVYLVQRKRVGSIFISPPCTTFSIAAHPMVRSHRIPEGFSRDDPKTFLGNRLAFMAILIVRVCLAYAVACILENPRRSKMFWLQVMRALFRLAGIVSVDLASCAYGSPHLKEFKLVGCHVDFEPLRTKCLCPKGTKHLPVQGKYAKQSAVYTPRLSQAIARVLAKSLQAVVCEPPLPASGMESLLVNDTLLTAKWVTEASWSWDRPKHINLHETFFWTLLLQRVHFQKGAPLAKPSVRFSRRARLSRSVHLFTLAWALHLPGTMLPIHLPVTDPCPSPDRSVSFKLASRRDPTLCCHGLASLGLGQTG